MAIRPLNYTDAQKVFELETQGFPEAEAASLEAIKYRLEVCPELCSGLFVRKFGGKYSEQKSAETDPESEYLPDKSSCIEEEKLIAHVMATKIQGEHIVEEDSKVHVESSPVIGVHSVCVHKDYQRRKLGTMLMMDYLQKMSNQQVGDVMTLMCKEEKVKFYETLGFENAGKSANKHGGADWYDMDKKLIPQDDKM